MTETPVIHVVDDDPAFRTAISRALKVSGYEVAGYGSATSFLRALEHAKPGCIVLDVRMPAVGGLRLQEEVAKLSHSWPIIFMTGHGDIPTSVRAIKAGADDFLSKPASKQTLLEAIERALVRHAALKQTQEQLNHFRARVSTLTPRESEVFALMVRGKLNKQIADLLGTSERTVKAHRHMVMSKLQVQSFAEAVSIAERFGLLTPSPSPDATEERSFKRENRSQRDLVEQAEKLALADLDAPLHISALCRVLNVSERTLRKAFHNTCGLAPCRQIRMLRLSHARSALLAADCKRVTVTEVATGFGFLELGRFSVEYRKMFGESPSQTLHVTATQTRSAHPRAVLLG
jgi:FixJ family two-component response regulator/AraC-like DNA-binding protein